MAPIIGTDGWDCRFGEAVALRQGVDAAVDNIASFRERHGLRPQHINWKDGAVVPTKVALGFPIGVSIMGKGQIVAFTDETVARS